MAIDQMKSSDQNSTVKMIVAFGGIVWKQTSHGPELAVIHRARHGDWCLPKGKPKEGELSVGKPTLWLNYRSE